MTKKLAAAALAAILAAGAPPLSLAQSMAIPAAPTMPAGPIVTAGTLSLAGAFARATLPNAPAAGGFLTITNNGAENDRLIAAASPVAAQVQLHEMRMEGDVMKMAELENGIKISPGETVSLAPGGLHIMFMGLKQAFVEGETVPVTLTFRRAGTIEIELQVMGVSAGSAN